jgi:hypothetical protein
MKMFLIEENQYQPRSGTRLQRFTYQKSANSANPGQRFHFVLK